MNEQDNQYQDQPQMGEFKVNIYPVMYWALAFGAIFAVILWLLVLLAQFVTIVWFPVFAIGLAWGGFRNYKKQQAEWHKFSGMPRRPQSAINEFKEAARDIWGAGREMMAQQQAEDDQAAAEEQYEEEEGAYTPAPQQPESGFESAPIPQNPQQSDLEPPQDYPPQPPRL